MATKNSHRIGIWIIASVMLIGTLGSFIAMMLGPSNQATDDARKQQLTQEYQAKVAAQATELSNKYFTDFKQYSSQPAVFDAASVTEVSTKDLKAGTGEEIKQGTPYSAYYIGWNPKGTVFDQSIDGEQLKSPIPGGSLIPGWEEGVKGMKIGGVREISIPSAKAYGEAGSGENIPANTPLKFIVMAINTPEEIPVSEELSQYYANK